MSVTTQNFGSVDHESVRMTVWKVVDDRCYIRDNELMRSIGRKTLTGEEFFRSLDEGISVDGDQVDALLYEERVTETPNPVRSKLCALLVKERNKKDPSTKRTSPEPEWTPVKRCCR